MEWYTLVFISPHWWSEPIEKVWRLLGAGLHVPGSKVPRLTVADQLFIVAVANSPRPIRPWGVITWLADVSRISRPTVYELGKRAAQGLAPGPGGWPVKTY